MNPIFLVCGELDMLDLLVAHGANASTSDANGAYPAHYAAQMCGGGGAVANGGGASPVSADASLGLATLRRLLAHSASVSVRDSDGRQPLMWAASAGSADAVLALVEAGADVSDSDGDGLTALHCAASRGHRECAEALISLCGARVDAEDANGCSPLFYSVTLGHAACATYLLQSGADASKRDKRGRR